jgi:hypothetical protein
LSWLVSIASVVVCQALALRHGVLLQLVALSLKVAVSLEEAVSRRQTAGHWQYCSSWDLEHCSSWDSASSHVLSPQFLAASHRDLLQ